jgi:biopolymer transport protein ExbB
MKAMAFHLVLALTLFSVRAQESSAGETLQQALTSLRRDIAQDTAALQTLREQVDRERLPLAERLQSLQQTVKESREELDRIQQARTRRQREQARLLNETEAMETELQVLQSLFAEAGRGLDTRMPAARPETFTASLQEALDPGLAVSDTLEKVLDLSLTWNQQAIGGTRFPGSAVDSGGMLHPGTFALLGPMTYFSGKGSEAPAGIALLRRGSDLPGLYTALPPEALAAIEGLTRGEPAQVPVDASGGDAIRVAEASTGWLDHLKQGGYTMIPLALVAVSALLLAIWKSLDLARMRVKDEHRIHSIVDALRTEDLQTARAHADTFKPPLRQLLDDLITHRNAPREHLEEILHEHVLASLPYIERNLGALAVLGGVAPLLGLLGTVTGMIHTFQLVTLFGSGDAKLLSGGISEALVTTETGLIIAIPTLLVHAYLARRARALVGNLETRAITLVNDLKLRGPKE